MNTIFQILQKFINLYLIAVVGLTGFLSSYPGMSTKTSGSHSSGLDLEYVLTINNPGSHEAKISLKVRNITTSAITMREVCTLEGCWINVNTFQALDQYGNPLVVVHTPGTNSSPGEWTIQTTGISQMTIEYAILPKQGNIWAPMYFGYITSDFAMFPAEYAFLLPSEVATIGSMTISFHLPQSWQIVTPWPGTNGVYNPLDVPHIDFYHVFGGSVIGLGIFNMYQKTIGTSQVTVAVQDRISSVIGQDLAQKSWSIFTYLFSSWATSVIAPDVFIYTPNADDGTSIYGGSGPMGLAYSISLSSVDTYNFPWNDFAWELVETRWINYDWGIVDNSCVWYKAGASRFEGLKAVANTRIMNSQDVQIFLLELNSEYVNNYVNLGKDVPLASPSLYPDYNFHKVKGTLVNLLLAREIYSQTQGRLTYNDYNKYLIGKFGYKAEWLNEAQLKSELEAFSNSDFTQFFNNYIYGIVVLPMDWTSSDEDLDGLSNLLEVVWDTNPKSADTDGDGYQDGFEVAAGYNPTDPNSYPHLIFLPIIGNSPLP